ncbi:hypothetical protein KFE25_007402 [Diacronema lutheri]|uniref:Uncharacterized protein n=1 Tax=Diacronema lutheri TaxID=2081491 RepID=A0A8J5XR57_DIALT|nr:hypothetical protein KFE25_007402 [Diacronema lutheri]
MYKTLVRTGARSQIQQMCASRMCALPVLSSKSGMSTGASSPTGGPKLPWWFGRLVPGDVQEDIRAPFQDMLQTYAALLQKGDELIKSRDEVIKSRDEGFG